jgi:hypothetical protein
MPTPPIDPLRHYQELLRSARNVFARLPHSFWLIGPAAAGKSTLCRAIAARTGLSIYDLDAHIYGSYSARYSPARHPANTQWLAAANPLAWMLNLTPEAFAAFGRATTAEYLDLVAADLSAWPTDQPIMLDGGITHPAVLVQALPPQQIVCVTTADDLRVAIWETAEERAALRGWVRALPEPERMWQRFLMHDAALATTLVQESYAAGIPVLMRHPHDAVDDLAQQVLGHLGCA